MPKIFSRLLLWHTRKPIGRVRLPLPKLFKLIGDWRKKGYEVKNITFGRLFIKKIR